MCRAQLPVWQELHSQRAGEVALLSIAVDAQVSDRPSAYTRAAGATFPTALDRANTLSRVFGFKVVPNGILVDETGVIRYTKFGGFDIRVPRFRELVEAFIRGDRAPELERSAETGREFARTEAHDLFVQGLECYRRGDLAGTIAHWRRAAALEPDNNLVRKQVWALENPGKFYAGDIDTEWQQEQRRLGL